MESEWCIRATWTRISLLPVQLQLLDYDITPTLPTCVLKKTSSGEKGANSPNKRGNKGVRYTAVERKKLNQQLNTKQKRSTSTQLKKRGRPGHLTSNAKDHNISAALPSKRLGCENNGGRVSVLSLAAKNTNKYTPVSPCDQHLREVLSVLYSSVTCGLRRKNKNQETLKAVNF